MPRARAYAGATALAIILAASPVKTLAQTATAATEAPTSQPPSDDIVVTAQRRSENLRDVPLSIAAVTGTQLRNSGVTDTLALTRVAPGLKMDRVGNNTIPAIRGVTTQLSSPGSDPNVALYVDGIYQPSMVANTFDLPDVERIEVLKGPQGTLFGRNATGGAIQVITRIPDDHLSGTFVANYGNLNDIGVSGYLGGPIVKDLVSASITGSYRQNDGYIRDLRNGGITGGLDSTLLRGKLHITPSSAVTVDLAAFYVHRRDASNSYGRPLNGNTIGRFDPQAIIPVLPYDGASNHDLSATITSWGVSGKLAIDLGIGKLSSLTGYSRHKGVGLTDADYSYQPNGGDVFYNAPTDERLFSEEVNFASALGGPLNFVAGLFYVKGKGAWDPLNIDTPTIKVAIYGTQHIEAAAGFGEIYYDLTDKLSLIGGLRYSWERRWLESGATGIGFPKPNLRYLGAKSWNSVTPRASIKYKLTPDTNVYFTYSQGFKSGVYNTTALALNADGSQPLVNPEKIRAYEVGFKGRIAPAVTLNLAAFHYDYKDVQASAFQNVGGVPLSTLQNAASARMNGADLDLGVRLGSDFDVHIGGAYLDAKYRDFKTAAVVRPRTDSSGVVLNNGNVSVPFDASGYQMIRAPKVALTGTINFKHEVAGGLLRASATGYYSSRIYYTFDDRVSQKPYATVDARLSWSPDSSGLTLALYGRNLTKATYIQGTFITELADAISYAPPRTYGIEASFNF